MQQHLPFTVLKHPEMIRAQSESYELQQHLPFTVLKHNAFFGSPGGGATGLQQHLPFTVLKQRCTFDAYVDV